MASSPPSSAFRQSLPVLITSLVNKSGTIGLSLLPMLLVDGHYTTQESSWVMTSVKGSTLVATLVSGWLSDVIGLRTTLLASLLLAAIGLGFLPVKFGLVVLLVSGVVAQLGITSINSTMRLLLTRTVEWKNQKEALGWMRFVNNLGQVLSFGLATMTASLGAMILIWFDALTSFVAFIVGARILPKPSDEAAQLKPASQRPLGKARTWGPFIAATLIMTGWNFLYEFFMDGVAGRLKVYYPVEGLRIFSLMMVVNVIICAMLAVVATKVLNKVIPSLLMGAALSTAGVVLAIYGIRSIPLLFGSILLLTLGEIVYGALGQFLLIRSVPESGRENTVYSSAILFANVGRMTAAGLSFPLIVNSSFPLPAVATAVGVGFVSAVVMLVQMRPLSALAD